MEIVWKYDYVPDGQLEPDQFNRWVIIGYIKVPTKLLPEYDGIIKHLGVDYHLIAIVSIHQKGTEPGNVPSTLDRFCCNTFSAWECGNLGLGNLNVFGNTVDEVKNKTEEYLNKFQSVIKGAL